MQVPMVHRGSLLVCRVITKALVRVATAVIVEDLEGDVEELSLYNFRPNLSDRTWLPQGTVMIIKEPYLKYGSIGHSVTMRVDSPTDVVFVDETDRDLLASVGALKWHKKERFSVDQLRVEGNARFVKKDYEAALEFYHRALRIDPACAIVLRNKSAVLSGLDRNY
ncbi:TPR domain protein [Aphelenchoides avenae]|nr:TPR domain protein [Aphelenchus avenae]